MANLTAARAISVVHERGREVELVGGVAKTYYLNGMIGKRTDGYYQEFDDSADMTFAGLCAESDVATLTTDSSGDKRLRIDEPEAFEITLSSVAQTDVGLRVYASDDQTASKTKGTNGNLIGTIIGVAGTNLALVRPAYDPEPQANIVSLTDNSGGSASNTIAAATNTTALTDNNAGTADGTVEDVADIALSTSDTYTDSAVNSAVNTAIASISNNFEEVTTELATQRSLNTVLINAVASLAAKVNAILGDLEDVGITEE